MGIADTDIVAVTGRAAFEKGAAYHRNGRVHSLAIETDRTMRSRVRGSGRAVYDVTVVPGPPGRPQAFRGTCTCPMAVNCKHVAATILEARLRVGDPWPGSVRSGTGKPATGGGAPAVLPPPQIDPAIAAWLGDVTRAERPDDYRADVAHRLLFVLTPLAILAPAPLLGIALKSVRLTKTGGVSERASDVDVEVGRTGEPPKYLRGSDLRILDGLRRLPRRPRGSAIPLDGPEGAAVLGEILATGRARWEAVDGPILREGPPRTGRFVWEAATGDRLRPRLRVGPGGEGASTAPPGPGGPERPADAPSPSYADPVHVFAGEPPIFVDVAAGLAGPIETGLDARRARRMFDAPLVAPAAVPAVAAAFAAAGGALAGMAPAPLEPPEIVDGPPVPVVDLLGAVAILPLGGFQTVRATVGLARLSFRYGPVEIAATEADRMPVRVVGRTPYQIRRSGAAEREARASLLATGLEPADEIHVFPVRPTGAVLAFADDHDWIGFLMDDVPDLETAGFEIRRRDDFPIRLVRADGPVEAEVREGSGIDWFDLDLGIRVDGERFDLVAPLVRLITRSDPSQLREGLAIPELHLHFPLPDGRLLGIPAARLLPLVEALLDLLAGREVRPGEPLRLDARDAATLATMEAASAAETVWRGGERIRAFGRRLADHGGIPDVALPPGFQATLRPYQARGLAWLAALAEAGFGVVLADDMGLGKTLQALAHIAVRQAAGRLDGPVLVVAPTSLMTNWSREAARFAPELSVLVLQGPDRAARFPGIDGADLVLTTYPLIVRDRNVLGSRRWSMLILDEAQAIKNPAAATTKAIRALDAGQRVCLTGTPLENNLGELWSLFDVVAPGFLGDARSFARRFRTPIEKKGDGALAATLARRVKPFLLRRTKDEVAADLPPKTEIVERVALEAGQRDVYEAIRLAMNETVRTALADKGLARSRIVILDALLKLRQACCDPRLVKSGGVRAERAGSAKLERLMEMIEELVAEGRRILVFSQFTSMLDLIRPRLDELRIPFALLTGDTRDRPAAIAAFEDGRVPVFLISLKAGGVGLNLTTADTVILYDPWWNPAVERQAIDRAHRIGQDKPVFVYRLVAADTLEEKIEDLKARKAALAEAIFDRDGAPTSEMTEADLIGLLA